MSIPQDALLLEHVLESSFVRKTHSDSIKSVLAYAAARSLQLVVKMPLAVAVSAIGATQKKWDFLQPHDGLRSLAALPVGNDSIVRHYYGFVVYKDFRSSGTHFGTYGGDMMKVTREPLLKGSSWLARTATNKSMVQHTEWIFEARFCAMRYEKVDQLVHCEVVITCMCEFLSRYLYSSLHGVFFVSWEKLSS